MKLKSTLYFDFCFLFQSLFDLKMTIEKRQVHKRFIKLSKHYYYGTTRAIKFLDLNFLYISPKLGEKLILILDKGKIFVQKFYNTANQCYK